MHNLQLLLQALGIMSTPKVLLYDLWTILNKMVISNVISDAYREYRGWGSYLPSDFFGTL